MHLFESEGHLVVPLSQHQKVTIGSEGAIGQHSLASIVMHRKEWSVAYYLAQRICLTLLCFNSVIASALLVNAAQHLDWYVWSNL